MPFNFHPPLSSVPIALCAVILILELINFVRPFRVVEQVILINLLFLVAGVTAAFFSGYQAAESANITFTVPPDEITYHHNLGRLALFAVIPCAAARFAWARADRGRKIFGGVYAVLLCLTAVLIGFTGLKGGELVFRHGAGVSAGKTP